VASRRGEVLQREGREAVSRAHKGKDDGPASAGPFVFTVLRHAILTCSGDIYVASSEAYDVPLRHCSIIAATVLSLLPIVESGALAQSDKLPSFQRLSSQAAHPPKKQDCRRTGSLRVEIAGRTLDIPRVLATGIDIPSRGYVLNLECDIKSTKASEVFLQATTTRGGQSFYSDWINNRRLPPQIWISQAKAGENYFEKRDRELLDGGRRLQRDENGLDFVNAGSALLYVVSDETAESARKFVVDCPKIKMIHGGYACSARYRYRGLRIRYTFEDARVPKAEWRALDNRLRDFIDSMMAGS
jgi:hypothetical protein